MSFSIRRFLSLALPPLLLFLASCGAPPTPPPTPPGALPGMAGPGAAAEAAHPLPLPAGRPLRSPQPWASRGAAPAPVPQRTAAGAGWRFTCPFGRGGGRAVWDLPLAEDLRRGAALIFRFRGRDTAAVNRFFVYFKSGNGWYGTSFAPAGHGGWETVVLWKHASFIEGEPAGWGRIEALRISATPAAARDVTFEVADPRIVDGQPGAAILRNSGAPVRAGSSEARSLADFPARLGDALVRAGIWPLLLEDQDLADGFLARAGVRTVLLPYTISLPPAAEQALKAHLARGGRLGGFFKPPAFAAAALEFTPGRYVSATAVPDGFAGLRLRSGQLPGAPVEVGQASWLIQDQRPASGRGRVLATWQNGRGGDTGFPAIILHPKGFWMSHVYLDNDRAAGSRLLLALLAQGEPELWAAAARDALLRLDTAPLPAAGRELRRRAETAFQRRDYPAALALADQCRSRLQEARLAALPAAKGERRGAWCHRPYGIAGWSWEETVANLKRCGFDRLYANLAWPAAASYPSHVLPAAPEVRTKGDLLAQAAAACRKHDVELHVWISCLNLGESVTPAQLAALQRAGRLQVRRDGSVNPRWLCPTQAANRRLIVAAAQELAERGGIAGIHLDFIRYPDGDHCFCPACRQAFERMTGRRTRSWPPAANDPAWSEFRRRQIGSLVAEIHAAVRREDKRLALSAAVFDHPQNARAALGQDWADWCRQGWLDWVCPMNYTANPRHFAEMVRRQQAAIAGSKAHVYPGIGVRALRLSPLQAAEQILVTRELRTGGFTIFEYNADEARSVFPELAKGLTRPP
ncbi:MAG: family 10 glycosylhydrolase [Lentisphaeria bacterium]